ncbi:muscarinic acetylcholine receptor M5-like [Octopus vulgaris]|uniref:Muscarinic acetylcholine receptor M5-like n=2 Tax=Octopus TaxID=6643 RepID=A0AA36EW94_OCTVU|nr:histamine H3 receptor-like [Octopus sinensis]CAI9715342.1 muscarinic acetylcholine receptor M5-like [Octopus vulgaris]
MENVSKDILMGPSPVGGDSVEFWKYLKVLPVITLTLITLIGNGLVTIMFIRYKQLRKCKNIFIVSLAFADFLIGCTMPVYILEELGGRLWSIQGPFCRVFLMFRYSLFYISLLSIMLISVDRWWSINHPFSYRVRQSRKLALWSVLFSWGLSFAIYAPPTLGWNDVDHSKNQVVVTPKTLFSILSSTVGPIASETTPSQPVISIDSTQVTCHAPFENNLIFIALTSIILYLLPLLALWIINASIYFKISQRKGMKIRRSLSTSDTFFLNYRKSSSESDTMGQLEEFLDNMLPNIHRKGSNVGGMLICDEKRNSFVGPLSTRRNPLSHYVSNTSAFAQYARIIQHKRHVSFDATGMMMPVTKQKRYSIIGLTKGGSTSSNSSSSSSGSSSSGSRSGLALRRQSDDLVKDMFVKQDKKAACSLGFLVLVFTLCWTPYTVCSILRSAYGSWYIPSLAMTISYWVLATNSAINPFLYGLCNSDFRKAFRSWCKNRNSKQRRFEEALLYYGIPQNNEPEVIHEQTSSTPSHDSRKIP